MYTTYKCLPPVTVVALSTGWYSGGDRCLNYITVRANGRSVKAKVVDECDSTMGCDDEHDYQPPCPNNIVDASKAVWEALGPVQRKVPQVQSFYQLSLP
ncbi:hypothetical protein RDI58_002306 [Solanum bulbocastanum]|uniref:Uncharacterized protein n=1 Tax=Solanum bulbocastanum TaxID=147425 RepID=A0AAN8UFI0_SOLBU